TDYTRNVVVLLEGTDPVLKEEYVIFGAHYDHTGVRANGEINNGADDDGSGTVALLEIAQAMSIERPKRSVVIVWHTGEEKGLRGARYFTENPPIPLENISVQINMDMVGRNPDRPVEGLRAGHCSSRCECAGDPDRSTLYQACPGRRSREAWLP
ncbi:MAG: M28 family peptidase, partial [Planctomycetes bacterium]|nr:M28 family peptidase [Planctomycetota bacterium]